jgi:hypothetical protein
MSVSSVSSVSQTTRHLFMVEPAGFYFNYATAPSNPYQINDDEDRAVILGKAVVEFHAQIIFFPIGFQRMKIARW